MAGNSQPYAGDEAVPFLGSLRSGRSPKTGMARLPNRKKKQNALAVISSSLAPNPNTTEGGTPPDFLQKVLKNLHWLKQGKRNQTSDCDRGAALGAVPLLILFGRHSRSLLEGDPEAVGALVAAHLRHQRQVDFRLG